MRRIIMVLTVAVVVATMLLAGAAVPALAKKGAKGQHAAPAANSGVQAPAPANSGVQAPVPANSGVQDLPAQKALPTSGGIPIGNVVLLGLGAGTLLVGGGLFLVGRRITP